MKILYYKYSLFLMILSLFWFCTAAFEYRKSNDVGLTLMISFTAFLYMYAAYKDYRKTKKLKSLEDTSTVSGK